MTNLQELLTDHLEHGLFRCEIDDSLLRVDMGAQWIHNPHCMSIVSASDRLGGLWFCTDRAADSDGVPFNDNKFCEWHQFLELESERKWRED